MLAGYTTPACSCFISGGNTDETNNFLSCAPCPPPRFDFNKFVSFAENHNLSDCEIDRIASKCRLEAPTIENLTDVISVNETDKVLPVVVGGSLDLWTIALIVVAGIISLVALLILGVYLKYRKSGNRDEKSAMKNKVSDFRMQYSATSHDGGTVNVGYYSQESIAMDKDIGDVTHDETKHHNDYSRLEDVVPCNDHDTKDYRRLEERISTDREDTRNTCYQATKSNDYCKLEGDCATIKDDQKLKGKTVQGDAKEAYIKSSNRPENVRKSIPEMTVL